eukprot:TRINITY_DN161_c0_g1_i14.p5 TRINITY_DN161_c0_g1~~TRINITY_DN161_c0_g1_i14.p5  ORF type:complete len:112 (-),score=0.71 TRINITY_DN161_c0_g1_i14:2125-2460(-)
MFDVHRLTTAPYATRKTQELFACRLPLPPRDAPRGSCSFVINASRHPPLAASGREHSADAQRGCMKGTERAVEGAEERTSGVIWEVPLTEDPPAAEVVVASPARPSAPSPH